MLKPEPPGSSRLHAAPAPPDAGEERFVALTQPGVGRDEMAAAARVMESGWLINGPRTGRFEEALQETLDLENVVCVSSCTAALTLSMHLLGIGPGDEVLLPTLTFVGCANVVEHTGARPVFVDSEAETGQIDLDHAASLVNRSTRGLLVVHLGGRPLDQDALRVFSDRFELPVVEDAAHSVGASWRGCSVGGAGNLTAFSFHASKNLTTIEGGALVTRSPEEAERVRRLALQGISRSPHARHGSSAPGLYDVPEAGFKLSMNDVAAAIGIVQLERLRVEISRRREIAAAYDEALIEVPVRREPPLRGEARHAHHVYPVRVTDHGVVRDRVAAELMTRGIGTSVHFRPIHEHSYYARKYGLGPRALPHAHRLGKTLLSLPLHGRMSDEDVAYVAEALAAAHTSR